MREEIRRHWILVAAIAAGLLGGVLSGGMGSALAQERTRQITAERFVVVDANGNKRGEMGLDPQGRINLTLYSESGKVLWTAPVRVGLLPVGPTQ